MSKISLFLAQNIPVDEFCAFYYIHNITYTAKHFNTSTDAITAYCKANSIKKTKEQINQQILATKLDNYGSIEELNKHNAEKQRQTSLAKYGAEDGVNKQRSESLKKTFQAKDTSYTNTLKSIDKEQFIDEYINQNRSREWIKSRYSLSEWTLDKVINEFDCHKSKKQSASIMLESKYSKYGGKEAYDNYVSNTIRNHFLSTYGVEHPMQLDTTKEKLKQTNLSRYGVEHALQSKDIRSKVAKSSRFTALEKRMLEFLKNNKFEFEHHYVLSRDSLVHEFDFAVFNNGELSLLIDCDGLYYHGYLDDVNGKSVNNYTDDYRATLIPEGVKFLVCVEGEEQTAYKELLQLQNIDYDSYIESTFNWCRSSGFPYPNLTDDEICSSYNALVASDTSKFTVYARYGERAILGVHKSIWSANKEHCLSPLEAWNDNTLLRSMINNRIIYKGSNLHREDMLRAFSVTRKAPRVSIFNPYLAKYLVDKYLKNYSTIFDPCSGYSGRMLGACSLGKHYIGQDVNKVTVEEAKLLKDVLNLDVELSQKDSLSSTGSYPALFTCPPYNLKETWGEEIVNKGCDDWIDKFIKNYSCEKYLFVVDSTEKYKDYIVEELENKSHFNRNVEYVVLIDRSK